MIICIYLIMISQICALIIGEIQNVTFKTHPSNINRYTEIYLTLLCFIFSYMHRRSRIEGKERARQDFNLARGEQLKNQQRRRRGVSKCCSMHYVPAHCSIPLESHQMLL